jgi:hypothetical protein
MNLRHLMKWSFVLTSLKPSAGGWAGGQGLGETSWTLRANRPLPNNCSKCMGKAVLLKMARELCAQEGGQLVVMENGEPTAAWEWRDAGECDPDAAGNWEKTELDPREFKNLA